jgi:hypothetical protein
MSNVDDRAVPRNLAETDAQIQTLRRHVAEECVAITSSIDTIRPAMVPREMRDRWLRALRQAMRAVALVQDAGAAGGGPHLSDAGVPRAEGDERRAHIDAAPVRNGRPYVGAKLPGTRSPQYGFRAA